MPSKIAHPRDRDPARQRADVRRLRLLLPALLFLAVVPAHEATAALTVPSIIGPNMVVQCDVPVPIWGRADPGETVSVAFGGQRVETRAGADGAWRLNLASMRASDTPSTMTIAGKTGALSLTNVLVGEVWLASGQSNMTLRVSQADDAEREIASAGFPRVRLFTVTRRAVESGPQWDCDGRWVECSPKTVGTFSAVAYFFGRALHQKHKRPVGLIHSSWGGTRVQAWMPREVLAADDGFRPILDRWALEMADFERIKTEFESNRERLTAEWEVVSEEARAAGRMPPAAPRLRTGPDTQYAPCGLFNGMIAPLAPYSIRGVIWYQGEANVLATGLYQRLFPAMIDSWRAAWACPDLPFLYVQLPNLARQPEPSRSGWAEMREAQLKTLAVSPRTAMVVTIDVGDPANLHPTRKEPIGLRLALAADAVVYGGPVAGGLSPVPLASAADRGVMRVDFAHADGGLATRDGAAPRGFVIAGEDRVFVPADVRLEGASALVSNASVPNPVAVRYAWADNPDATVIDAAGLPLSPFRTDAWATPALAVEAP